MFLNNYLNRNDLSLLKSLNKRGVKLGLFSNKPKKIPVPLPPGLGQSDSRHTDFLDISPSNMPKQEFNSDFLTSTQQPKAENPFKLEAVEEPKKDFEISEMHETNESKEFEIKEVSAPEEVPGLDLNIEIEKIEKSLNGPVHVQIDDYKDVIESMNKIKDEIIEAESILSRIEELKSQKEFVSNSLRDSFEDIERKLTYLDNQIFERA